MSISKPTVEQVRIVYPPATALPDATVQLFIDQAAIIVAQCPAVAGYDEETQKAIIMWMAAHALQTSGVANGGVGSSGVLTSSKLGDAQDSYAAVTNAFGKGFNGSYFGMQAIALDPSGCIQQIGKLKMRFKTV